MLKSLLVKKKKKFMDLVLWFAPLIQQLQCSSPSVCTASALKIYVDVLSQPSGADDSPRPPPPTPHPRLS